MSLTFYELTKKGLAAISKETYLTKHKKKDTMLWIDAVAPSKTEKEFLTTHLVMDHVIQEDAFHYSDRPKLLELEKQLFLSFNAMEYVQKKFVINQINFFLTSTTLVSIHGKKVNEIILAKKLLMKNHLSSYKGSDYLLHFILDLIVDNYFTILDALSTEIDLNEKRIFTNPNQTGLRNLFALKRVIIEFRKSNSPQRESLLFLSHRELPQIKSRMRLYFQDLYDHAIRAQDLIDSYRDLISSAMDAYISIASNRLNEIMKVLTIIATIMLPLTLITGIYGMNFQDMPELTHPLGYPVILLLMAGIGLGMAYWFYSEGWIFAKNSH